MALLWCEGFDHYGTGSTGRTNMLNGTWAEVTDTCSPSGTQARTGSASLRFPDNIAVLSRRVFPAGDLATVGFGCGIFLDNLPTRANSVVPAQFRNDSNGAQVSIVITPTGRIQARRGAHDGTLLGESGPVITAAAWNHFECRVTCDDVNGEVEVRVNGVSVLDIIGVDTRNSSNGLMAQVAIINGPLLVSGAACYYDDVFAWDTAGANNNDFIGPQRVYTLFPDGDTVAADWAPDSGVTGYTQIDEVPPDADASYIEAASVSDVSEFDLQSLPAEVAAVNALQIASMVRKTDAGTANVQASLVSSAVGSPPAPAVANGADRPITEVYTYWPDVIENDPATGAPWTAAAVNAVKLRLEKTA